MCQHDKFNILYYSPGLIIRRCIHCKQTEFKTEDWLDLDGAIELFKEYKKEESE